MSGNHVVVWIDHKVAKILYLDSVGNQVIKSKKSDIQVHQKAGIIGDGKDEPDKLFFKDIVDTITKSNKILILGPGIVKNEFAKFINTNFPQLNSKITGVVGADHPTDKQIIEFAKKYFSKFEKLLGI